MSWFLQLIACALAASCFSVLMHQPWRTIPVSSLIATAGYVVFLLLVFFLVASQFIDDERSLDIQLPTATEVMPLLSEPHEIVLNVSARGEYFLAGRAYLLPEVEKILQATWNRNPTGTSVIVRGDKRAPFGSVVAVVNVCKKLNLKFSTVTKEDGDSEPASK